MATEGSPIDSLLDELISNIIIFDMIDVEAHFGLEASQRRDELRTVCRRWARVIDETPYVWTWMSVDYLEHSKVALSKSGEKVSLNVDFGDNAPEEDRNAFLACLAPHAHRWESFTARTGDREFLDFAFTNATPKLEALTLWFDSNPVLPSYRIPREVGRDHLEVITLHNTIFSNRFAGACALTRFASSQFTNMIF